ncbi:MAG: hypothetical protein LBR58_04685 [Propionibacteriaceae bacterium]|jgi:tetratricopeptide (TPR) repeat protein|nr:hypothetical protein [Propionibacteriaceae bacterium]
MTAELRRELDALYQEIDETWYGPQERALIDRALAIAAELGDEQAAYKARLMLTRSAAQTGDTDAMLTSFAWCLGKHDSDPEQFPYDLGSGLDLMWQFKWMSGAFNKSSVISLEQTQEMLDDMETHYRKAGIGMSGVLQARFQHAWRTGDLEAAKKLHAELLATPRDDYSHCDACSRSDSAGFAAELGDWDEALRLVDEIMSGGFSCGEEPEHALSRTLLANLRAGRLDDAKAAHTRSYRLARQNPDNIEILADNLVFCAVTGNAARGLAMVERHIAWLAHDALNEAGQLDYLLATAAVLESVVRAGHGDQLVRGADQADLAPFFGPRDGAWTAQDLAPVVWQAAIQRAQAFDARNRNNYVSSRVGKTRALLDEQYCLPIHSDAFLDAPPQAIPLPTDSAGWRSLSTTYFVSDMSALALKAAEQAVWAARDAGERAAALRAKVEALVDIGDPQALQALMARIDALREAGNTAQADLEEKLGPLLYGAGDPEGARLLLEGAEGELPAGPQRAEVRLNLAKVLSLAEEPDLDLLKEKLLGAMGEAEPEILAAARYAYAAGPASTWAEGKEALDQLLEMDVPQGIRAAALRLRARYHGGVGEFAAGAADADEATRINASLRMSGPTASSADLAGNLLIDAGRPDEAAVRFRYGLRETEALGEQPVALRWGLGKALLAAGHAGEAAELFHDIYAEESDADAPAGSRAETLGWLGQAHAADEEFGYALGCFADAANLYEEAEDPASAAQMLWRRGQILRGFEQYDDALADLERAHGLVAGDDAHNGALVRVLEGLSAVKSSRGDDSALDDIDRAIAIAKGDDEDWVAADLLDSKARALHALEREDEAVAAFLAAADAYEQADDSFASARAEFFAGQLLHEPLRRPEESAAIMAAALDKAVAAVDAGGDPGLVQAMAIVLSDVYDSLGRAAEAAEVRKLID